MLASTLFSSDTAPCESVPIVSGVRSVNPWPHPSWCSQNHSPLKQALPHTCSSPPWSHSGGSLSALASFLPLLAEHQTLLPLPGVHFGGCEVSMQRILSLVGWLNKYICVCMCMCTFSVCGRICIYIPSSIGHTCGHILCTRSCM